MVEEDSCEWCVDGEQELSNLRCWMLVTSVCMSTPMLHAGPVFVKGQGVGQGYTRARGSECFVITAAHVVGDYSAVALVTYSGVRGTADVVEKLAGDISILRVEGQGTSFCSAETQWGNAMSVQAAPNSIIDWSLEMITEAGTEEQMRLTLVSFDPNTLYLRPRDGNDALQRGMSGSPIIGDGRLMGLLVDVEPGDDGKPTARIIRLKYLDALLQGIFVSDGGAVRELSVAELQLIDSNIALAKLALDEHHDCKTAREALSAVPVAGQRGAFWHLYMARCAECLGDFKVALTEYTVYNSLVPGQAAILEKIASVGYNLRHGQELAKQQQDLSGYWIYGDIFIWMDQSSAKSVQGYVAGAKAGRPIIGELWFQGNYENGILSGDMYGRYNERAFEECDQKLSIDRDRTPFGARLNISDDAQTLEGDRADTTIEFSDCTESRSRKRLALRRLPETSPSTGNEVRPRLSRDEIMREVAVQDRFRVARNNLAGTWTTQAGDLVTVSQEGEKTTGTFSSVSDYTQSHSYYTTGTVLFSGRYKYGALHGTIRLGWSPQEVMACHLNQGLEEIDGRIKVADDGSSFEVYAYASEIRDGCVRTENKRLSVFLTRVRQ
jgi:hypothetical protein